METDELRTKVNQRWAIKSQKKIFFFLLRYNISLNFSALKSARKASFLVTVSQNLVTFKSKAVGIFAQCKNKNDWWDRIKVLI